MKTEVVAEIGVNHQNDFATAVALIEAAKAIGATAVKFQASTVREEVSFLAAPEHFMALGMVVPTWDFLRQCRKIADNAGIEFLCTPAGPESLDFVVNGLGVKRLKIASDNLDNPAFLRAAAATGLPLIVSTGMATMGEFVSAAALLAGQTPHRLTLLHCVSAYPCPPDQINLGAMLALRRYGRIGLSDHSESLIVPAAAVAMGAEIIEKHITLDRGLPGPDHAASLPPEEFSLMIGAIQEIEAAMGKGHKEPMPAEMEGRANYRKGLYAARPIAEGEMLTLDNVQPKRPASGARQPAGAIEWVVGHRARRAYETDEAID